LHEIFLVFWRGGCPDDGASLPGCPIRAAKNISLEITKPQAFLITRASACRPAASDIQSGIVAVE
jgi:hypothetical protein